MTYSTFSNNENQDNIRSTECAIDAWVNQGKKMLLWEKCNKKGLYPLCNETEEDFIHRISKHLQKNEETHPIPKRLETLWRIMPIWVPIKLSSKGLTPWERGCIWTQDKEPQVLVQIHPKAKNQEEILAHELTHAGRYALKQHYFEELFAYQTSTSSFRRFFGALFLSPIEPLILVISLALLTLFDLTSLWKEEIIWISQLFRNSISFGLIFCLLRLSLLHLSFKKACKNLQPFLKDATLAPALLYRLTDREIWSFAWKTPQIEQMTSFRWQFLKSLFFSLKDT